MIKPDNKNIEEKIFMGGVYMTPNQLNTHMETIAKQVSEFYQRWTKAAKYNTRHQT